MNKIEKVHKDVQLDCIQVSTAIITQVLFKKKTQLTGQL